MKKHPSFLAWVARTQTFAMAFLHAVIGAMLWSLSTEPVDGPWGWVIWPMVLVPLAGYWCGNWWYWSKRLRGK